MRTTSRLSSSLPRAWETNWLGWLAYHHRRGSSSMHFLNSSSVHHVVVEVVVMFFCLICLRAACALMVFSMQLLRVIVYLFCIPGAVLWDCCSFNYSLILKDQRSQPSTPCISLELCTHAHAGFYTHGYTCVHVQQNGTRFCSVSTFFVFFCYFL